MHRRLCIAAAITAMICGGPANAQFVNGVENFNGTSVDTSTWVAYGFSGAATVANGYLDLTGQYYLTSKMATVGVGDTVSARVMLTAPSPLGTVVSLGLTTTPNSPFSNPNVEADMINSVQGESELDFFVGRGSATPRRMSNNVGSWYRMQITRNTASSLTAQVLTDSGTPLVSVDSTYAGLPDQASVYIGLGPTARFDWVAVPEPTTTAIMASFGFLLVRRWRSGRW